MSKPIVWIQPNHLQQARKAPFLCRVEPTQGQLDFVPLYAHPPAASAAHESYWHKIADERAAEIVRLLEAIEFILPMWEEEVRGHYSAGARTNGTKALEMLRAAIDSEREKG